jgi:hypothetical protein
MCSGFQQLERAMGKINRKRVAITHCFRTTDSLHAARIPEEERDKHNDLENP